MFQEQVVAENDLVHLRPPEFLADWSDFSYAHRQPSAVLYARTSLVLKRKVRWVVLKNQKVDDIACTVLWVCYQRKGGR